MTSSKHDHSIDHSKIQNIPQQLKISKNIFQNNLSSEFHKDLKQVSKDTKTFKIKPMSQKNSTAKEISQSKPGIQNDQLSQPRLSEHGTCEVLESSSGSRRPWIDISPAGPLQCTHGLPARDHTRSHVMPFQLTIQVSEVFE